MAANPFDELEAASEANPFDQFDASPEANPFDQFDTPEPTQNYFVDKTKRLARAAVEGSGDIVAGLGSAAESSSRLISRVNQATARALGVNPETVRAMTEERLKNATSIKRLQEAGASVRALGQFYQPDPARDAEFGSKIATGAGSLPPLIASAALGPVAALTAGGAMMGEQGKRDAAEAGATPDQQAASFALNAPVGAASELLLGTPAMLKSVLAQVGKTPLTRIATQSVKGATREGAQEGIEQATQNVIAKDIVGYDPTRDRTAGVLESAALGAVIGAPVAGAFQGAQELDTRQNLAESKKTLLAQQQQLVRGLRPAQMFPVDADGKVTNELPLPPEMARVATERGVFHYNPAQIDEATLLKLSGVGRENGPLGLGSQSKADVAARVAQGDPAVTVTERQPDGTEVKASVATLGTADQTAAELAASKTPGNTVQVESLGQVVTERSAAAAPNFIEGMLAADAAAATATREAAAKEEAGRTERQTELAEKKARFEERLAVARQTLADPAASFPAVDGALTSLTSYAEDRSIGLTQTQREQALAAQAALQKRHALLAPDAAAAADTAAAARRTEAKLAEDVRTEKVRRERTTLQHLETTGRDLATGEITDLTNVPDEELATLDANAEGLTPAQIDAEQQRRGEQAERTAATANDAGYTLRDLIVGRKSALAAAGLTSPLRLKSPAALSLEGGTMAGEHRKMGEFQGGSFIFANNGLAEDGLQERLQSLGFDAPDVTAAYALYERALAGEEIRPERGSEQQVDFAAPAATPGPILTETQVAKEFAALRREFPALTRDLDLRSGLVADELKARGYTGPVPPGVQAAILKLQQEKRLLVIAAKAAQEGKASGLFLHEMAHPFFDALPPETKTILRELHAQEMATATGPLFNADGQLLTDVKVRAADFPASRLRADPDLPVKEWFAERVRALNADWLAGRTPRDHSTMLRVWRELLAKLRTIFAQVRGLDPDSDLFTTTFRRWLDMGGKADLTAAGLAYATRQEAEFASYQDTMDLGNTPLGLTLPNEIRNLAPRWQDKILAFDSSLDKALYYAGGTPGELRTRIIGSIAQQTQLSAGEIAALARDLRQKLAPLARPAAANGTVRVPAQMQAAVRQITAVNFAMGEAEFAKAFDEAAEDFYQSARESVSTDPERISAEDTAKRSGEILTPAQAAARLDQWKALAAKEGETGKHQGKTILSLFDSTGVWSRPWREAGFNVVQVDQQIVGGDGYEMDVMKINQDWLVDNGLDLVHGVLAACPCTEFAGSGARWFKIKDADGRTKKAAQLVNHTLAIIEYLQPDGFWAIENPIGRLKQETEIPLERLQFQPHNYGDPYTKRTQIYGSFDAKLPQANVEPTGGSFSWNLSGNRENSKAERSTTFEGFAYAFFAANYQRDALAEIDAKIRRDNANDEAAAARAGQPAPQGQQATIDFATGPAQFEFEIDDINLPVAANETQRNLALFGRRFNALRERVKTDRDPTLLNVYVRMGQAAETYIAQQIETLDDTEIVETVNAVGTDTAAAALILRAAQKNYGWPAMALVFKNGQISGGTAGELVDERSRKTDYGSLEFIAESEPGLSEKNEGRIMRGWRKTEAGDRSLFEIRGATRNELKIALWKDRATVRTLRGRSEMPAKRLIVDATSSPRGEFVTSLTPETERLLMQRTGLTPDAFWSAVKNGDVTVINQLALVPSPIRRQFAKSGRYVGPIELKGAQPATRAERNFASQATIDFATGSQTDTPAFKAWFGASKVVEKQGTPLRVYHGTRTKGELIEAFDPAKIGSKTDAGYMGRGFYFGDARTASVYAGYSEFDSNAVPQGGLVYPVYLSLKNPIILRDRIENGRRVDLAILAREAVGLPKTASAEEVTAKAKTLGHDGAIYETSNNPDAYREYVVFRPEQIKSAIGNRGTFDAANPRIDFATGPATRATVSKVSKKNDYLRVGTSRLGTNAVPLTTPATSNIHGKMVPAELLAKQMPYVNYPHLPQDIRGEQNPVVKRDKFVAWMKSNLLALYKAFPADVRARATQWYDGANTIATDFSARFGTTLEQASGVLAVLSPQKDWFMNVAQAEQVMDIWKNHQKTVITKALVREQLEDIINGALATPGNKRKGQPDESPLAQTRRRNANARLDQAAKDERRKMLERIMGKTVQQLEAKPNLQGWAIRILAQSIHGREFRIISPEGDAMGVVTKKNGKSRKNGWGSISEIKKAVRILKNGSLTNISDNLGAEHKVRNFYNNIVAPNTPFGDATMDTHAVAAAHIMPFGSSALEVKHNFGIRVPGSGPLGVSGIYHLYIDAYTDAAKELGLLPRQLQSITWEAIRQLYSAESRRDKNVIAAATAKWKTNTNGNARAKLLGNGISRPTWAGATNDAQPQGKPARLRRGRDSDDTGGGLRFRGRDRARGGLDQAGSSVDFATGAATDTPVFYSRLTRTVEQSPQGKASGAQWKATIRNSKLGVNQDEFALVGVGDLEDSKTYTKTEVLDYLRANEVKVQDVTLGGPENPEAVKPFVPPEPLTELPGEYKIVYDARTAEALRYGVVLSNDYNGQFLGRGYPTEERAKAGFLEILNADLRADAMADWEGTTAPAIGAETQFARWQLPGAVEGSYREVLLTLPENIAGEKTQKKVADFSAKMAEKYKTDDWWFQATEAEQAEHNSLFVDERFTTGKGGWRDGHGAYSEHANPIVRLRYNERTTTDGKRMLFLEEVQAPQPNQFEKMPALFQKNWREIAFKWALRKTSEEGYDSVGWTTGEQQAARYDLSKQISRIEVQKVPGSTQVYLAAYDHAPGSARREYGRRVIDTMVNPGELDSYIGKEFAAKVETMEWTPYGQETPQGETITQDHKVLSGLDLKIGGQGLKKLYDVDFRNVVNNLPVVRKSGQKVGSAKLPGIGRRPLNNKPGSIEEITAEAVHAFTITPEIRAAAMQGQAQFATGPDTAARLADVEQRLAALANSQEDPADLAARGRALKAERDQLKREIAAATREAQAARGTIDVRHPAAVAIPSEPGDAWAMAPQMTDGELAAERDSITQHIHDQGDGLAPAMRAHLNARLNALSTEQHRRGTPLGTAVVALPQIDRQAALVAELTRGRALAADGNRTGNDAALNEGNRLVRLAKARLDEEFPGWDATPAPATKAAATQPPLPPEPPTAEAAPAAEGDGEQSPFSGSEEETMPVRPGKWSEVYGHSSYTPSFLLKTWRRISAVLTGIRGPIPELPTFPAARWNKSDPFIAEHGPQFYARIAEGERALKSANDYLQRTAADQIGAIIEPLLKAEGKFSAEDYAQLRAFQEQARRTQADGKPLPPSLTAGIAALHSKMESSPYVLFNRLVFALDLHWRVQNLKDSAGNAIVLPAGINAAETKAELARLSALLAASPHAALIQTAITAHRALVAQVAEDLKSRELLAADHLANPYYFPHLTLETTQGGKIEQRELTPARVRPGTEADFRGYLETPVGSKKAIEQDYVRAMYYHLVQVGAHNFKADAVRDYFRPYDIKATVERRAKELTKERGVPVTWEQAFNEEFAPRGYVKYGTDSRDAFPTLTINRDLLARRLGVMLTSGDLHAQLKELNQTGVKLLPEDIRESLTQGERETWIVPSRVAEALRGIGDRLSAQDNAVESALKWTLQVWKSWKLFMPMSHIRYEYGNIVADSEKLFSGSPGTFKYLPIAAKELRAFWLGGKPSTDLQAALKDGVLNAITAQELDSLVRIKAFEAFETRSQKAWDMVKRRGSSILYQPATAALGLGEFSTPELSALREAITRYAHYQANLEAIRAGARPAYGGAYWRTIEAMTDSRPGANDAAERKAAAISKATFGDYGDLSVLGQTARDKFVPFYSWMEINFRYHANLLRNLNDMVREGDTPAAAQAGKAVALAGLSFTARAAGGLALRLALPYLALALWNNSGDRDELEKLLSEEDRRRTHLILGRDGQGKVLVVYGNTALMDVMKWISGPKFAQAMGGWLNGKTDFATAAATWRDAILPDLANNTAGSFGPYFKIPYTLASGKAVFPDITDQKTIPAYDMRRAIIGQITDDFTADLIERTVNKDYYGSKDLGDWAKQLIMQVRQRDPESWAFYSIKDKANDYLEKRTGTKRDSSLDAPEQQVLRNFRRAIYRGDVDKAVQFYQRLLDYGYTAERFQASIRSQDPLSALPKENGLRKQFVDSLNPDDRAQLDRAYVFYQRMNASRGQERQLFPSQSSGFNGQMRYQAQPRTDLLRAQMQRVDGMSDEEREQRAQRDERRSLQRTH